VWWIIAKKRGIIMYSKFKIGDKVKLTHEILGFSMDKIYTVTNIKYSEATQSGRTNVIECF
jgi:hypothetical protein